MGYELDIISSEMCSSLNGFYINIEGNEVYISPYGQHDYCPCGEYKDSFDEYYNSNFPSLDFTKMCKHIMEGRERMCGWHKGYSPEIQFTEGVCPRCRLPTVPVRVGV